MPACHVCVTEPNSEKVLIARIPPDGCKTGTDLRTWMVSNPTYFPVSK